jgi:hypothetical protein
MWLLRFSGQQNIIWRDVWAPFLLIMALRWLLVLAIPTVVENIIGQGLERERNICMACRSRIAKRSNLEIGQSR